MVKKYLRLAPTLCLIAGLVVIGVGPAFAADHESSIDSEELESSIRRLVDNARHLRPLLDRSQFELGPLLDSHDYDSEGLIRFVTEEIRLEIYAGALRGAHGTLVSQAGNALDQSLLLATLLKDSGYEARINRGRLEGKDVEELIARMFGSRDERQSIWSEQPSPGEIDAEAVKSSEAMRSAWVDAARTKADLIVAALEKGDVELDGGPVMAEVRKEAQDYYWVELRDGPAAGWRSAHPAMGHPVEVEALETYAGEIPQELTQRIKIELLAEVRRGAKVIEAPLIAPIELASANVTGVPLEITMLPDQLLNQNSPMDIETIISNTRFLLPLVNGEIANGAKVLSLRGLLVPPDSLGMGAAGLFETISEKGAQAIDALSGLGKSASDNRTAVAIQALRLRVTLRSPDGTERVALRELFDEKRDIASSIDDEKARQHALVVSMSRTFNIVFATGTYHDGFVLDNQLEEIESLDSLLAALDQHDDSDCETLACISKVDWQPAKAGAGSGMYYHWFDSLHERQSSALVYRHMPNLVALSRPLFPKTSGATGRIDIISNSRRALVIEDDLPQASALELVLAGTWETQIETDLVGRPGATTPLPAAAFENLRVIEPAQINADEDDGGISRAMWRDLSAGYVLLVNGPYDVAKLSNDFRWWRVDPVTGETLGMNQFGGAATTEELILVAAALGMAINQAGLIVFEMNNGNSFTQSVVCSNPIFAGFAAAYSSLAGLFSGSLDSLGYAATELRRIKRWCVRVTE